MEINRTDSGDLDFVQKFGGHVTITLTNNYSVVSGSTRPEGGTYDYETAKSEIFVEIEDKYNKRTTIFSCSLPELQELLAAGALIVKARKDGAWPDVS